MSSRQLMWASVGVWAACFAASWIHASVVVPGAYGLNVLFTWFLWQCVAITVSVICLIVWLLRRHEFSRPLFWIGLVPPVLSIGGALAVTIWYFVTD